VCKAEEREREHQASLAEVDEVADKLQREFLLVSALSSTVFDNGREEFFKTVKKVSWVEMAMQDA
jgi:hypothetical protein